MVKPYFNSENIQLFHDDCLKVLNSLPANSVNMIFADPPYFLSNGGFHADILKEVIF